MELQFKEWKCIVVPAYYGNGRKALKLNQDSTNEPIAVATVNVVDFPCSDDCVYIKDYAENEGMVEALIKADIIHPEAIHSVPSGYVMIGMYKLTNETLKLFK